MGRTVTLVTIAGAALAVLAGAALAPTACSTHACDASFALYEAPGGVPLGEMVDDDTWESNPLDGQWLDFPGEREWLLHIPALEGRDLVSMDAFLSEDQFPSADGSGGLPNWASASGNLAEWRDRNADYILVKNDTCGQYFARFVVRAAHAGPDAGGVD